MADILASLKTITSSPLYGRIMSSIDVVIRSIELYGESGLALSLNGGKDSTVLLHLIRAAVHTMRAGRGGSSPSVDAGGVEASASKPLGDLFTFFFDKDDDFEQVVAFTKATADEYNLNMRIYHSSFFEGLEDLLSSTEVKAIFLGTRRGDPNADSQVFSPSSQGWPVFMRINPIMEWSYHDVWEFLLLCKVPYCSLYDEGYVVDWYDNNASAFGQHGVQGNIDASLTHISVLLNIRYTSLGSVDTTFANGALLRADGKYSPAHMLTDPKLERSGRVRRGLPRDNSEGEFRHMIPTAGLVIIGDEILSGKVEELNCKFLLKQLRAIGWRVLRVSFVGDNVDDIAQTVNDLSQKCDAVLTCGGLGPTLDDVTMKAVAKAIGRKVSISAALEDAIRQHFGEHVTAYHLKMASVPDGPETVLIAHRGEDGRPSPYPLVRCRNIYILPGVPSVVEKKWGAIRDDLGQLMTPCLASVSSASVNTTPEAIPSLEEASEPYERQAERKTTPEVPFQTCEFRIHCKDEAYVAAVMEDIHTRFGRTVSIGSYPQKDGDTVLLSLESKDGESLLLASSCLRKRIASEDGTILIEDHDLKDC